jgi:hypothetical protein
MFSVQDHPSQKLSFSENRVTELDPKELAQLYVKYSMLYILQLHGLRYERDRVKDRYEPWGRVATEFPEDCDNINPTTPEEIQSELHDYSTRCKLEPKSLDE